MLIRRWIQAFFLVLGGALGYHFIPLLFQALDPWLALGRLSYQEYVGAALGALLFLAVVIWTSDAMERAFKRAEEELVRRHVSDLLFGTLGMLVGLLVAFFIYLPLKQLPIAGEFAPIFISILLAYLGFTVGHKKKDELIQFFSLGRMRERGDRERERGERLDKKAGLKLLDTSVIIDGRIADIVETGFLEGTLLVPEFVLAELQHIADSSDMLKRNRGRRGLDILKRMQKNKHAKVVILERDVEDVHDVDAKLIRLAKELGAKIVTTDFNLNKVCELQGIPVLNVNDLANALKPIVLPGEELVVHVIKDGKEHGQGVAYLDDGTMIVVEGGKEFIGEHIGVLVTSVLQTSAGRMVFAKPKLLEKAL
ncbi:PIN/TRAM domain-containing protein [Hydrogenibacillus sp. N12]|uniref:PIN/TRAM domain-containing protein n=1 Tax=Hydrogenibacillus sp. N12 TaxID=2866627 RepID=UPI001C7DA702|nr:PIN/TRAM domain-containing protein [Hydrogenibacillus sp. N12]QZA33102.1 PIN/TRAM domain-containing protein [Hydrogenibacillus sp. N12]